MKFFDLGLPKTVPEQLLNSRVALKKLEQKQPAVSAHRTSSLPSISLLLISSGQSLLSSRTLAIVFVALFFCQNLGPK